MADGEKGAGAKEGRRSEDEARGSAPKKAAGKKAAEGAQKAPEKPKPAGGEAKAAKAKADDDAKATKQKPKKQPSKAKGAQKGKKGAAATTPATPAHAPYMQNRELSWLMFDQRCLEQGADKTVPLLERLQFVSIFRSNLQEFFMVRVGSLTDLALMHPDARETKTNMTPKEQLDAIYDRCHTLSEMEERVYQDVRKQLAARGVRRLLPSELDEEQRAFLDDHMRTDVLPFLSPQIVNARHPFPHLANGALYVMVRLEDGGDKPKSEMTKAERAELKRRRKEAKNLGAEGVVLGIIPIPANARRVIRVPGDGFSFVLLEDALEDAVPQVFSMYKVKRAGVICVTRNADLDATEAADETEGAVDETDYREYMKAVLKKRSRLAPVRLESNHKLHEVVRAFLQKKLDLKPNQVFTTSVPMDMGHAFALPSMVGAQLRDALMSRPFSPAWPAALRHDQPIMDQVEQNDVLLSFPYESMDPFVRMLREAADDPSVVSIKITLYRLASESHLAEALIAAAEAGEEVTALFELRARFDESNNIRWSQRFEQAGANVIYGFHDLKVHSKICCITRNTDRGFEHITQLGTGNYNEKTAKLYTDFSYITTDPDVGRDAVAFFRNMGMETLSRDYSTLWVAPLQIKQNIIKGIDEQIARAKAGRPSGLFFKTNSVTDKEIIEKIEEASRAGVRTTMLVRGICCLLPGVPGHTDNVRVVSIVGRLLEHSRIYGFGPADDRRLYLASADLMTRNMDKRVEIAWPVTSPDAVAKVERYIKCCLSDTAKLRELKPDGTYTALRELAGDTEQEKAAAFNAQEALIKAAADASREAAALEDDDAAARYEQLRMRASKGKRAMDDLQQVYREALQHEIPEEDMDRMEPLVDTAVKVFRAVEGEAMSEGGAPKAAPKPAVHVIGGGAGQQDKAASPEAGKAIVQVEAKERPKHHGFFWRLFHHRR